MPPFVENYSNRYRVNYTVAAHPYSHSMVFHYGVTPSTPPNGLIAVIGEMLTLLEPMLAPSWAIQDAEYCVAGGTVFLPALAPEAGPGSAAGEQQTGQRPLYIRFEGVNLNGVRTSFRVYGVQTLLENNADISDYRVQATEDASIASALGVLNGSSSLLTCIDGVLAQWRNYVNVKHDSRMVKKLRG